MTRARWLGIIGLAAASALTACSSSDDRALVILDVMVAADVPAFETLRFTSPSSPSIAPRELDGASHRVSFKLGYYVPRPPASVVIVGRAVAAGGCVVAEGTATVMGVQAGKQVNGGTLTIAKLAVPVCAGDGGAADAGGADGGGDDVHADAGDEVRADTAADAADARMDVGAGGPADASGDGRADAPADVPIDAPADVVADARADLPPKLDNGQPCTAATAGNCTSGKCVDGVCCESDCAGTCRRCNASGVCAAVNSGTDPETCEGDFVCSGGSCGCPSPKTACGNTCRDLATDPANCRTCGTVCAGPPANGSGVCLGAAGCGVQCQSGHLACGGLCCDTPPANAFATCPTANQCGVQCNATYHACNGAPSPCYSDTDVTHCGPGCLDCRQPNASVACGGSQCANSCVGMTLACAPGGGKVACGSWNFDSQTTEGWTLSVTDASDGSFGTSTTRSLSAPSSLAIGINSDGLTGGHYAVRIKVRLCASGQALALSSHNVTVPFLLVRTQGSPIASGDGRGYFGYYNGTTLTFAGGDFDFTDNGQWTSATTALQDGVTDIELVFGIQQPWRGTLYVDSVAFN